jgi:SAM-dependent methyltransferase
MNHIPDCPLDAAQKSALFAELLGDYDQWVVRNYIKANQAPVEGARPCIAVPLELFAELTALALQHAEPTPAVEERDARTKSMICKRPAHYRFVDAGCGTGMTLQVVEAVGRALGKSVVAEGVELQESMVEYARKRRCTVHRRDLRTFDFRPYDVVYIYHAMLDMKPLLPGILDQLRPGAVIIAVILAGEWAERADYQVLYRKQGTIVAERVGPDA